MNDSSRSLYFMCSRFLSLLLLSVCLVNLVPATPPWYKERSQVVNVHAVLQILKELWPLGLEFLLQNTLSFLLNILCGFTETWCR
jgi:hypothetical protein